MTEPQAIDVVTFDINDTDVRYVVCGFADYHYRADSRCHLLFLTGSKVIKLVLIMENMRTLKIDRHKRQADIYCLSIVYLGCTLKWAMSSLSQPDTIVIWPNVVTARKHTHTHPRTHAHARTRPSTANIQVTLISTVW